MKTDNNYLTKKGCEELAQKLIELSHGEQWDRYEFYTTDEDCEPILVRFILVDHLDNVPKETKKKKKSS